LAETRLAEYLRKLSNAAKLRLT